jgi:hypothetical protein
VPINSHRIRWDLFVTNTGNTKGALSLRPPVARNRQKSLPPVRNSNLPSRTSQTLVRQTPVKQAALPPIENNKKTDQNLPIIFILSKFFNFKTKVNSFLLGSSSSTTLCSRLIERYNQITYLYINDIANIDVDEYIGKIHF